jgi:hypothetical protein
MLEIGPAKRELVFSENGDTHDAVREASLAVEFEFEDPTVEVDHLPVSPPPASVAGEVELSDRVVIAAVTVLFANGNTGIGGCPSRRVEIARPPAEFAEDAGTYTLDPAVNVGVIAPMEPGDVIPSGCMVVSATFPGLRRHKPAMAFSPTSARCPHAAMAADSSPLLSSLFRRCTPGAAVADVGIWIRVP